MSFRRTGIFWHERKPTATYSQTQWLEKKNWISDVVAEMDADVIPEEYAYLKHVYKLYDSFNLVVMQGLTRPNTHGGIIADPRTGHLTMRRW